MTEMSFQMVLNVEFLVILGYNIHVFFKALDLNYERLLHALFIITKPLFTAMELIYYIHLNSYT